MISVEQTDDGDPMVFSVAVDDKGGHTKHRVTMSPENYDKFTGGSVTPPECIHAAFRFLLEREPQNEILPSFDIKVIQMYFPNFEKDFGDYL